MASPTSTLATVTDLDPRWIAAPGSFNFRDLGGLDLIGGGHTAWRNLFRSDLLRHPGAGFDAESAGVLELLGVSTVIDLRTHTERRNDGLVGASPVLETRHVPVFEEVWRWEEEIVEPISFLTARNIEALSNPERPLATVLRCVAEAPGRVMFHCTAGKDRTGLVAVVLCALSGVTDDAIVEDYCRSSAAMVSLIEHHITSGSITPELAEMMRSWSRCAAPSEVPAGVLSWMEDRHGSVEGYADWLGVTDDTVARIRRRLRGDELPARPVVAVA